MSVLTSAERQLLLETAFAGVNHGLWRQVRAIVPVVPNLVTDRDDCAVCMAVLLLGLEAPEEAVRVLEHVNTPDANVVKQCFSL
ncbi:EscG/YscG/SsaH family type III secretion system needle protein co-chaperone [Symbiopectobacterium purcellii]|uniref:EscG/YscG/SsaH family type III secretion system needle protein co-chaperone n=1 Tax=Symbiopectobacterium purcellii TaxID=2871826 RepID=UPI00207694B2|nr:EscG/YscG/SsaH family type III secretion system needle protein co-chaperone [Symbiopectobacterium purcellii]